VKARGRLLVAFCLGLVTGAPACEPTFDRIGIPRFLDRRVLAVRTLPRAGKARRRESSSARWSSNRAERSRAFPAELGPSLRRPQTSRRDQRHQRPPCLQLSGRPVSKTWGRGATREPGKLPQGTPVANLAPDVPQGKTGEPPGSAPRIQTAPAASISRCAFVAQKRQGLRFFGAGSSPRGSGYNTLNLVVPQRSCPLRDCTPRNTAT